VGFPCKRHQTKLLVFYPLCFASWGHRFDPGHVHHVFNDCKELNLQLDFVET